MNMHPVAPPGSLRAKSHSHCFRNSIHKISHRNLSATNNTILQSRDLTSFWIGHFQNNHKFRTPDNSINIGDCYSAAGSRHDLPMFTFNAGNPSVFSRFRVIESGKLFRSLWIISITESGKLVVSLILLIKAS